VSGVRTTPLEEWAAKRIGAGKAGITREQLARHQLLRLRATIGWALETSPFYRSRLAGCAAAEIACPGDLGRLPFTTADDVRRWGPRFLCVSQSDVSRVVTLDSSGTTGQAKRFYFTPADQEGTVDFFQYGMASLTDKGDRVLILLPGERPGGVGDLLAAALRRLGVRPVPHGMVVSIPDTLAVMAAEKIDTLVGIPSQVLALARWADSNGPAVSVKSILLSTDHVPRAIVRELERVWGCEVFEHYGMTELGLGGGTDCAAHAGYHLHEADFYFEVVDPESGAPVPEGGEGEVVVTTLTRRGMPLIRYRTGDISRMIPGRCPCGSVLRRLAPVARRRDGLISLGGYGGFSLADLDEALFAVPGLIGFTAAVDRFSHAARLTIAASLLPGAAGKHGSGLAAVLDAVPAIRLARQAGALSVAAAVETCRGRLEAGAAKRAIVELS